VRFSKDTIDEVRSATDIVELISEYLPLRKAGKYHRTLCPFHNEKQPSFYVSPSRQIFHCFGCGKSGNAFTFLIEYEKLSFPESVEFLAKRAGVVIERYDSDSGGGESDRLRQRLYRANDFAASFYHTQLSGNARALRYLTSRGVEEQLIEEFRIGYAPDSWDALIRAAEREGISVEHLKQAGLVLVGEKKPYDMFRKRITFPVCNLSSRVVGFGARAIDDSSPKYINTSETKIYRKGEILFGLHKSKRHIRKMEAAVLVEGYTDFLALYSRGIRECVATCGTAFTRAQAKLISRYGNKVILMYDSDAAGTGSALRSIDLLLGENLDVHVVTLPRGEDPDSYIRSEGTEEFRERMGEAEDFLRFKLRLMGKGSVSENARMIHSVAESIQQIPDRIRRTLWLRELSRHTGVEEEVLAKYQIEGKSSDQSTGSVEAPRTESELLGMMARDVNTLGRVRSSLEIEDFSEPMTRELASVLFGTEGSSAPAAILDEIDDVRLRDFLAGCLFSVEFSPVGEEVVEDYIQKIQTARINRRLKELKRSIEEQEKQGILDYDLLREHQKLSEMRRGA
jgi:DNA primase